MPNSLGTNKKNFDQFLQFKQENVTTRFKNKTSSQKRSFRNVSVKKVNDKTRANWHSENKEPS
jgi:hypothetical protein